jgi:hypothetical protein
LVFRTPGYIAYCSQPGSINCFVFAGSLFPREGCTVSYTWYVEFVQTWNICNLSVGAASGISTYDDEQGEHGIVQKNFTSANTTFDAVFEPSETYGSETDTVIMNSNNVPIQYGYAFNADENFGAPPYQVP